jgi:hypothetical protein
MATLLDDEVDPYAKYLVGPKSSVTVAVGAPSIYDNAKPISTPKIDTANLDPDLQSRIAKLNDLWKSDTVLNPKGEDLPITSGYRTREQQRQLYLDRLKNPNLVAEPGKSRHETGLAIDLHPRVPDTLLETVGLFRPHGKKDMYHVQVNPTAMETVDLNPDDIDPYSSYLKEQGVYTPSVRQAIGSQFAGMKKDLSSSDYYTSTLPKQVAALGDVVYGAVPAAVKFVGEPFAKLVDKLGDTTIATEALDKVTQFADRPIGKAFGITNDPAYNAEAANRMMEYVGKNMDKGADYLAKETGLPKSDVAWFMNAALIGATPYAMRGGKKVYETGAEILPKAKEQMQTQYENVKAKVPGFGMEENPNLRSVGSAEVPKVQQRINNARSLLEPIDLPRDIATRDFADIRYAREKAKEPEVGAPLRQNYAKINEQVIRNFDREIMETGAKETGIERGELGQRLNDVVNTVKKERYDKVQEAYKAADTAGETLQQVPYEAITNYIADKRPTVVEQNPILKQVKEELEHNDPNKTGSISLRQMEDIRQLITSEVEPGTSNGFHGKKIKEDIDKITKGKGGQLYQQARSLNHQYMKEFEETPSVRNIVALKKNTTERTVPLETIAEKTMLSGPRSHVVEVFKTLENAGPEGQAMINELRGIVGEQIKNEALQSAKLDVNGNPTVSADKLNKIINKLDKSGKLELIFGKQGAERYRTLNEVSKDIYTVPEGSVNTSNTGATVKGYLADIAASYALSGVPAPIAHIGIMGKNEVLKRRDLNRINEFINYGKEQK